MNLKELWKNRRESSLFWVLCISGIFGGVIGAMWAGNRFETDQTWETLAYAFIGFLVSLLSSYLIPRDVRDTGENPEQQ